jgi:predicted transcriptional regulator/DNA-binding XRE family transcriptional regulator
MAERKIFAGGRLKRLRQRLGLSQTQMASEIGVSPSYLNLIERNQRPLTVQVLPKLSGVYGIDVAELSGDDGAGTVEALKEVFSDPLLVGEIASPAELSELADAAPNAARGMTRLFEAYREALERLSDLSRSMASEDAEPAETASKLPFQQAAAYFEDTSPWFPALEEAAEKVAADLKPRDDPGEALRAHLGQRFGVDLRILPAHVMPVEQLRYDRHSLRFFISERVPLIERPFLLARQIALLGHGELIDTLTRQTGLSEPESLRICRSGFARRLAEAVLAPASRLGAATRDASLDVMLLSQRFMLKPSRIMARLAALGASGGASGGASEGASVPQAFMLMLDASGTVMSRIAGGGFPFPRFAPLCPRLPLFDNLVPGQPLVTDLALPNGDRFHVIALAEEGPAYDGLPPPRRLAMIGGRHEDGQEPAESARPIGVTCRLCERADCAHRLHPPVAQTSGFQDHFIGAADYELTS